MYPFVCILLYLGRLHFELHKEDSDFLWFEADACIYGLRFLKPNKAHYFYDKFPNQKASTKDNITICSPSYFCETISFDCSTRQISTIHSEALEVLDYNGLNNPHILHSPALLQLVIHKMSSNGSLSDEFNQTFTDSVHYAVLQKHQNEQSHSETSTTQF